VSSHSASLTGLNSYEDVNFHIRATASGFCNSYDDYYGNFTPYNPHSVILFLWIFAGAGTVKVGSNPSTQASYHNGSTLTVSSPDNISLNESSNTSRLDWAFGSWYASGYLGYFLNGPNHTTPEDTLHIFTSYPSGELVLVLESPTNVNNTVWTNRVSDTWAGVTTSRSPQGQTTFTQVSGEFVLPRTVTWEPGNASGAFSTQCFTDMQGPESVAFWVGLGWGDGTPNLWQAGVLVSLNSSTATPWVQMVVQDLGYIVINGIGRTTGCPFYSEDSYPGFLNQSGGYRDEVYSANWAPRLGDDIVVYLNASNYDSQIWGHVVSANFTIYDRTLGKCWGNQLNFCKGSNLTYLASALYLPYPPDKTTADWISEDPTAYLDQALNSTVTFTNMSVNYAFLNPTTLEQGSPVAFFNYTLEEFYEPGGTGGTWTSYTSTPGPWGTLTGGSWGSAIGVTISFSARSGYYNP